MTPFIRIFQRPILRALLALVAFGSLVLLTLVLTLTIKQYSEV